MGPNAWLAQPVELDKHLGGVINSLRERGEFMGDELETLLIIPPEGSIKAKALLLIGLGDEATLSLEKMERVGKVALREASNLGAQRVAFAPLIRDQGNAKLGTGDIAAAVLRGVLLANDTQHRMQQQGLGKAFTLKEWTEEAGPAYFDETTAALQKQVKQVESIIATRVKTPYKTK
ncbi:MAG: M17 family peptidase N-terminal domain-containing protein [Gemmatales bacterium]